MRATVLKQFCACDESGMPINPFKGGRESVRNTRGWGFPHEVKQQNKGIMLGTSQYNDGCDQPVVLVRVSGNDLLRDELRHTITSYCQHVDQYDEYLCLVDEGVELIKRGVEHTATVEVEDNAGKRKGTIEIQEKDYFVPLKTDPDSIELHNCTAAVTFLVDRYFDQTVRVFEKAEERLTDEEIMQRANIDPTFTDCYAGLWQPHFETKEEAVELVCRVLAFYSGGNKAQIERIFAESGLYDDSWYEGMGAMGTLKAEKIITKAAVETRSTGNFYKTQEETDLAYKMQQSIQDSLKAAGVETLPQSGSYSFSDSGNAKRFYDLYGNIIHYAEKNKKFFVYIHEEGRWKETSGILIKRFIDEMLINMKKEAMELNDKDLLKWVLKSEDHSRKEAVLQEIKHVGTIPIESREAFDQIDYILNVKNGTIDLRTGELMEHSPRFMCSKMVPIEYDPNETCVPEKFRRYMSDWICDEEVEEYVRLLLGYSLSGYTTEQQIYFLLGIGNDGKSTMMQIISEIMGDYACNAQPETFMAGTRSSQNASSDIARLAGYRLVYAEEATEGKKLDEGLVKQMTGSSALTARGLHEKEFTFVPRFKIWMPTNYKPVIRGTDKGIWRRVILVNFPHSLTLEEVDKMLVFKLREEYPIILSWLVKACVEWYNNYLETGIPVPEQVKSNRENYRDEMNIVRSFINDCMTRDHEEMNVEEGNFKIGMNNMYKIYSRWCKEGNEFQMQKRKFSKEVLAYCDASGVEYRRSTGNEMFCFGITQNEYGNRFLTVA